MSYPFISRERCPTRRSPQWDQLLIVSRGLPTHTHTHTHARTSTYGFVKFLVSSLSLSRPTGFRREWRKRMRGVLNGSQFLIYPACMDVRISRNGSCSRSRVSRFRNLVNCRTNTRMYARDLEARSVSHESNGYYQTCTNGVA